MAKGKRAPKAAKTQAPALDPNTVRVYVVKDSILVYEQEGARQEHRLAGEQVTSLEFKPRDIEQRYLDTGAIELKETLTKEDWAARQQEEEAEEVEE
jgi:hypothetical protein